MEKTLQTQKGIRNSEDCYKHSVLILNDNPKILSSLDFLQDSVFRVKVIDRISQALNLISKEQVEVLVICTTNPGVDVLTLCQTVNNNIATFSVGIIVITDSSSLDHQIRFYDSGVNVLLSYPFENNLFYSVLKNLASKEQRKNKVSNSIFMNKSLNGYQTTDCEWISKMADVIESNLQDSSFGIEQFASAMGSSKSTLYRKVKKLTEISPAEFIRNTRLAFASRLLSNTTDNISYIAYAVGFNDPRHFTNAFRSYLGVSPNTYRQNIQKNW